MPAVVFKADDITKVYETGDVPVHALRGVDLELYEGELARYHRQLGGDWKVVDGHHLEKTYSFENFAQALAFTNRIGELAEEVNHHPDLRVGWGYVQVDLWTHKIDGLSEADLQPDFFL